MYQVGAPRPDSGEELRRGDSGTSIVYRDSMRRHIAERYAYISWSVVLVVFGSYK